MEAILIPEFKKSIEQAKSWNASEVCKLWASELSRLEPNKIRRFQNGPKWELLQLICNRPWQVVQRYLITPQNRANITIAAFNVQVLKNVSITTAKPCTQVFDHLEVGSSYGDWRWACSGALHWALAQSKRLVKEPCCFQKLDVPKFVFHAYGPLSFQFKNVKEPFELAVTLEDSEEEPSQTFTFYQEVDVDRDDFDPHLSHLVSGFIIRGCFDRFVLRYDSLLIANWSAEEGKAAWRLNGFKPVDNAYLFLFNGCINFSELPTVQLTLVNRVGVVKLAAITQQTLRSLHGSLVV